MMNKRKVVYNSGYTYYKKTKIKCNNFRCGHEWNDPDVKTELKDKIDSLDYLIELGWSYHCCKRCRYYEGKFTNAYEGTNGLDLRKVFYMIPSLEKLNGLIGMSDIKQRILKQILFALNYPIKIGYSDDDNISNCEYYPPNEDLTDIPNIEDNKELVVNLNTVLTGNPGTGKTKLANIITHIYYYAGIIKKYKMVHARRSRMIGTYLGQTAVFTERLVKQAIGGVFFIDEVYSLGNSDRLDQYSKECIDTINLCILKYKGRVIFFIAGYKNVVREHFLKYNEGLNRRFSFVYNIKDYSTDELHNMFNQKLTHYGWSLEENKEKKTKNKVLKIMESNKETLKYNGGDVDLLLEKSIINSCTWSIISGKKNSLKNSDIVESMKELKQTREDDTSFISSLYA